MNFTVTPDANYEILAVYGCWGSDQGGAFTTGPIVANCAVEASFRTDTAGERERLYPRTRRVDNSNVRRQEIKRCSNILARRCVTDADCIGAGPDSDGDRRPDAYELGLDSDRDGIPDERDRDDDGDGFASWMENRIVDWRYSYYEVGDVDGNHIRDSLDPNVVSVKGAPVGGPSPYMEQITLIALRVGNTPVPRLLSNVRYYPKKRIASLEIPLGEFSFEAQTTQFSVWFPVASPFDNYWMHGPSRWLPIDATIKGYPEGHPLLILYEVNFETGPADDLDPGDAYLIGANGPVSGTASMPQGKVTITGCSPSPGVRGRPVTVSYYMDGWDDPSSKVSLHDTIY